MLANHTDILNYLIKKHNLKSYCEIGVQNTKNNFDKIVCSDKVGVDPALNTTSNIFGDTSDYFFFGNKRKFDLFFLDGLHTADQVKRDFENSLRCLNDNGFIVIHDTLPDKEEYATEQRNTRVWFGNVYQFAMSLDDYKGIDFKTINIDCGCTVVWKADKLNDHGKDLKVTYDWNLYKNLGKYLLNIIQPYEIETYL